MSGGPTTTTTTNDKQKTQATSDQTASTLANTNTTQNGTVASQNNGTTGQTTAAQGATSGASVSNPWAPSVPLLTDILGQAGGLSANATPTANETAALGGLQDAASATAALNPQINQLAQDQLAGNGVGTGAAGINSALKTQADALNPIASGSMIGADNPYLQSLLDTVKNKVTNSVGDTFAGAGRSFSGAHAQALGTGLTNAEAPMLLNQYNTERGNQVTAANDLVNNSIAGSGALDSSAVARNAVQGGAAGTAATTYDPFTTMLSGANYGRNIPVNALQAESNLILPIAGAGGQTSQTGVTGQTGQVQGTTADTGLTTSNQTGNVNATGSSTGHTDSTGKTTGTGTSVAATQSDPLQTVLGSLLGVGGMLASGGALKSGGMLANVFA